MPALRPRNPMLKLGIGLFCLGALWAPEGELDAARLHDPCDALHTPEGVSVVERKGRFETLRDVELSDRVEEKLAAIAAAYGRRTGKTFVVTSGTRAPDSQAELLFDKLSRGEDLAKLYKDKTAVAELVKSFDEARAQKKKREAAIVHIATTIRSQMKRGIFISAHLRAGAADVRNHNMDTVERKAFLEASREAGGVSVLVEDSPPHFHLQLE